MTTRGRPKMYQTEEERIEAQRKRKREWARQFRKIPTYKERVDKMTLKQYVEFLEKEKLRKRKKVENPLKGFYK